MNYIEHLVNVEAPLVLDTLVPDQKAGIISPMQNFFEFDDTEDKKEEDSPPKFKLEDEMNYKYFFIAKS